MHIILNLVGQVIFGFAMFFGLRRLRVRVRCWVANSRIRGAVAEIVQGPKWVA